MQTPFFVGGLQFNFITLLTEINIKKLPIAKTLLQASFVENPFPLRSCLY